jgi:hypothetical protein
VVIGPPATGKYLIPGTPLGGEHSPDEIKQIAAGLKTWSLIGFDESEPGSRFLF